MDIGQCSEICGVNHSFMPIVLDIIPINEVETTASIKGLISLI